MKNRGPHKSEYMPLWFKVRPSFYHMLNRVAEETGMSMADALTESVKVFLKLTPIAKKADLSPVQMISEAARLISTKERLQRKEPVRPLVAYRWEKTSPEQRSQIARDLARQRWKKRDESASPTA